MKMKKPDKEQVYTLQQSEKIRGMLKSIKVSGTSFYIALGFEVALVIITRFLRAKEFFWNRKPFVCDACSNGSIYFSADTCFYKVSIVLSQAKEIP